MSKVAPDPGLLPRPQQLPPLEAEPVITSEKESPPLYFTRTGKGHVAMDLNTIENVLKVSDKELLVHFTQHGKWGINGAMVEPGEIGSSPKGAVLSLRFAKAAPQASSPVRAVRTPVDGVKDKLEISSEVQQYDHMLMMLRKKNLQKDKKRERRERFICVLVILAYYTFGVTYFSLKEDWTFAESLYFVTVTLTTVGYGDLLPTDEAAKLVTCGFVFVGIALVGSALGMVSGYLLELSDSEDDDENDEQEPCLPSPWHTVVWGLANMCFVVFGGTLFYCLVESDDFNFVDAFYMSVITCTTVGYGDFSPQTTGGRLFGVVWILVAVILTAKAISEWASSYQEAVAARILERKRNRPITIADLKKFGGADGRLNLEEFILCKLKTMGTINDQVFNDCKAIFQAMDVTGDGIIDMSDIVAHSRMWAEQQLQQDS